MDNYKDYSLGSPEKFVSILIKTGCAGAVFSATVMENYKKYLSEFLGTFALIFVGAGCYVQTTT